MHRLLVETALLEEPSPALPANAAKHLRILRPKNGEEIELFDGRGRRRTYGFCASAPKDGGAASSLSAISGISETPRPPRPLTLFACITKGSRWDWTIEKATELGASRIVPVISERTIVRIPREERAAKRERWVRIAEDAARQSDAAWLPEILPAMDFADTLGLVRQTRCLVGALTDPPSPPIATATGDAVYVGPEGDFTPGELAALMAIATPVSFGPTILRAETAAIFAVSVMVAKFGEK